MFDGAGIRLHLTPIWPITQTPCAWPRPTRNYDLHILLLLWLLFLPFFVVVVSIELSHVGQGWELQTANWNWNWAWKRNYILFCRMSRSPSKTGKKGREMGTRGAKIVNTLFFNYFSETFYYYILILLFCKFRWCNSGEIFIFVCIPLISVHLLVYILYLHA